MVKKIPLKTKLFASTFLLCGICSGLTLFLLKSGPIAALATALLITAILTFFINAKLLAPLQQVLAEFKDIANFRKNLSHQITINSGDEVEELAGYANSLFSSTWLMINKVEQASGKSSNMAERINNALEKTSASTQEICSTMEGIARGTNNHAEKVNTTSQHAQNLKYAIKEITTRTEQAVSTAKEVAVAAEVGNTQMSKAMHRMKVIEESVDSSSQAIIELGVKSEKINQIVEMITQIANQTNLLALNAAIEAARAGEQGRGFAVVAEEVRELAEQSAQATEEITQLVKEIQETTKLAAKVMQEGTADFHQGTKAVEDTGQELNKISIAIVNLSTIIQDVAQIIHQQEYAAAEVGAAVQQISILAYETATGTEQVCNATQEQNLVLNEIVTSTNELTKVAGNLKRMVEKCKG